MHCPSPMLYFGLHWSEQLRVAPAIELTDEQESELTRLARSKLHQRQAGAACAHRAAGRAGPAEQGHRRAAWRRTRAGRALARALRSSAGLQGIERDLPRGAPPVKVDVAKLVELTTQSTPEAATHWSTRKMAAVLGVSPSTVMRHWQANGLKPHLVRGFKVSRDPQFVEKLEDIVGLYMSPPEHALVLCCDEKSQVQALDRTQPGLPLKKGRARHHDARLQAQRHDHAVRRAERAGRPGHRPVPAAPHPRRVAEVPAADRPRDAQGQDAASDRRQLRHAQAPGRAGSGWPSIRASTCTSRRPRRRG